MATITASGDSKRQDTQAATVEATRDALKKLDGAKPAYGFLFVSPGRPLADALRWARETSGAELIGCTTAGEITERGLIHDGVSVLLVASDDSTARPAFSKGLMLDPSRVAEELTQGVPESRRSAAQREQRHLTTVVLTDGLAGTSEQLVADLYERASAGSQVVGGAAGDEGQFKATYVGDSAGEGATDAAAALHVFGRVPWGVGVNHGLRPTTRQMRVTRAEGNVVHEFDGKPAFGFYQEHARARSVELTRANAGPYLIANELGIHFFDKIARVRAPLSVGEDGSLTCAAQIPNGSMVSILDGEVDSMIDAAQGAALEAKKRLGQAEAAGVLLFDCVCRGMILKSQFSREIRAVRSVFGDVPVCGFLTYGEIARYQGQLDGWHNATAVVVAIPK